MKRFVCILLLAIPLSVHADDFDLTKEKISAAMSADIRDKADTDRDRNRKPVDTLKFFGFRENMKIVEIMPGGGWYTKLLVPATKENGEYYAAIGTSGIKSTLTGKPGFENMQIVAEDSKVYRPEGSRTYTVETNGLGVENADMVLTFRNYHNFDAAGREAMNNAAYAALKSGGIYAVVDHTRRHMEGDSSENRRRIDPVLAINEIQKAGFKLVDYSDLHYRADDELRYEVGRKTVSGNTDRFSLKFIKE